MKRILKKRLTFSRIPISIRMILGICILFIIAAEIGFFFYLSHKEKQAPTVLQPQKATQAEIHAYAEEILAKCKDLGYRPRCYDEEIPKLMDTISMQDAFEVTRAVQGKDTQYIYCHVLGHELSAREVRKDPENWKNVVSMCPAGLCSNGCIHGGFQEKFRKASLSDTELTSVKEDLKVICEDKPTWHPTDLEQASCYHALGHLTMYLTNGDIDKSIPLCREISKKSDGRDFTHLCYDGAFMQIFQPLEPEDFALVKGKQPTRETVNAFCNGYSGQQKGSCVSESWPLFRDEILTPEGFVAHCDKLSGDVNERQRCIEGMFYVTTPNLFFDTEKIKAFCNGFSGTYQDSCFANSSGRLIETDYRNIEKSVALCASATTESAKERCYGEMLKFSTYNFHAGSKEFFALCNSLPETYKKRCLAQYAKS